MKLVIFGFLLVVLLTSQGVFSKKYTKCQLAQRMLNGGFPRSSLPDWVCLVQHESGLNSNRKAGPNRNKSYDWGLFQINDRYWCTDGSKGKDCNMNCQDLINDTALADELKCVKKIYDRHGFNAWYGWKNHCKGKTLPNVDSCFPKKN